MKTDWLFPRQVAVALTIVIALGIYPLVRYGTREIFLAAAAGMFIATANVLVGFAAIEYSFKKSATVFLKVVLGGMGVRMLVMVGLIVVLVKLCEMHIGGLVASLATFYVIFLTLEILFIQKRFSHKQEH